MHLLQTDERNERAWLWLSAVVDTDAERMNCLEKVIAINPDNQHALRGLAALRQRQATIAAPSPEAPTPWYFSTTTLALTFLFCTPVWALLTLADRRHGRGTKIFAGLVAAAYLALGGYLILYATQGAQFTTLVAGPGDVRFGSEIHESTAGVSLRGESMHFADGTPGDQVAWIASLDAPARTTNLNIVLSMGTAAGGEAVIASNPLQLADPGYDTIYGILSPALYFTAGTYTLRLMSGDSILAQGQFNVP